MKKRLRPLADRRAPPETDMMKTKTVILAAAAVFALTGCHSRRKNAEPVKAEQPAGEAAAPRAEFVGRLDCKAYDPYKSYEASGRAKPPEKLPEGLNGRLLAQKNAEYDAASKLLKEAAVKCNVPAEIASKAQPYDLLLRNSRVLSEAPDGTVNVTVEVLGKDILDLLGAVSRN